MLYSFFFSQLGSIAEQKVPFCVSRPVSGLPADRPLRNFDIIDVALNNI